MKTLEYLKIKIFNNIEDDIETKYGLFSHGYDNGYFQCNEDMVDKKYTEKDMLKAFMAGVKCESKNGKNFEQFINSLNKQD
jgi:hypothetical protein